MADPTAEDLFPFINKEKWVLSSRGSGSIQSVFEKSLPDDRVRKTGKTISPKDYLNTILLPQQRSEPCRNSLVLNEDAPKAIPKLREILNCFLSTEYRYCEQLGMLYRVFCACRASRIHKCKALKCQNFEKKLSRLMPPCNWSGFSEWALQVAACICARDSRRPCELPQAVITVCSESKGLSPTRVYEYTIEGDDNKPAKGKITLTDEFMEWEEEINIFQVTTTLTWLEGIATGQYVSMRLPYDMDSQSSELRGLKEAIENAQREYDGKLCKHRVHAVADCLPSDNRHLVITALLPETISELPDQDHGRCTPEKCEFMVQNSTNVHQLHVCRDKKCGDEFFPQYHLNEAVQDDKPGAWNLNNREIISGQDFMAISHLWADGTGAGNKPLGHVNRCLWDLFKTYAERNGCDGLWWDVISVPQESKLRARALNNMHENYGKAKLMLIHDNYLKGCEVIHAETAASAIVLSPWFSRGWTALELAKCQRAVVAFQSKQFYLEDILAKPGEPSSLARQVASTAIRTLRRDTANLNDLITALGPRHTSWEKDPPIIAGLLANVPVSANNDEIYQNIIRKFKSIPCQHLFHNEGQMPDEGFHWCPRSLLKMPKVLGRPDRLAKVDVMENGDVVGFWKVVELHSKVKGLIVREVLNGKSVLLDLKDAVSKGHSSTDNLILLDVYAREAKEGIVVQVKDSRTLDICCRVLGFVKFNENLEPYSFGAVKITIGGTAGMDNLADETAVEYVQRVWELRQGKEQANLRIGSKNVRDGW